MLGVRRYEAKEGARRGLREVDGNMNPSKSQRVLVVCSVVVLGVVLMEEVGAGVGDTKSSVWLLVGSSGRSCKQPMEQSQLLWKETHPDPRASPCIIVEWRDSWKPTSTQRQNLRNSIIILLRLLVTS